VSAAAAPGGLRDLLEAIDRRTRALDAREAAVETRLAMLQSLEHSVGDTLGRLEAGGCAADGGGRLRGGVTKIYENMRAEQAAAILDRLDDDTLRVVFAGMDPRRIGAIMAEMSRERAVAFTRTLAADAPEAAPPPATLARR
jgi:flagellar motility protein MotE (MotC chaperone)